MIQRLQQMRNNEEGFTLIELLIVIIVLGILAAIVVFAVGSTKADAVHAACKTDVKSIELSAEAVNTHSSTYPGGPVSATVWPGSALVPPTVNPLLAGAGNGALLKTFPTSNDYQLTYTGGGAAYSVEVRNGAGALMAGGCSAL